MDRAASNVVATGGLLSPSAPTPRTPATSTEAGRGLSLPPRHPPVTRETIADHYINFILYCNPAVPPGVDTTVLREAFWLPPKSEGKTFSTFALYELIGKLSQRDEVKTWGDLALRLGVERPKAEKQQSTQKIQQYAVRLKRWMKSMHVDAFFNYLYGEENKYFMDIPPATTPIMDLSRDGVVPEDDMALRALLPEIRPRRGRRAHDDYIESPNKIPRIETSLPVDYPQSAAHPGSLCEPWSAHPDAGGGGVDRRNTMHSASQPWDIELPPLSAHPRSALTPSTKTQFWPDELKSAISTSTRYGRPSHKRHGPKVVSSAWKSGQGVNGKTRGRPPNTRLTTRDAPYSAFPSDSPGPTTSLHRQSPSASMASSSSWPATHSPDSGWGRKDLPLPPAYSLQTSVQQLASPPTLPGLNTALSMPDPLQQPHQQHPSHYSSSTRPQEKPWGLSLQVPDRVGSEVRLATPPLPAVTVNGQTATPEDSNKPIHPSLETNKVPKMSLAFEAPPAQTASSASSSEPGPSEPSKPTIRFKDPSVRTNMDALEGFFAHEILTGSWHDRDGNRIPPCSVDEGFAIVHKVIQSLLEAAITEGGFILNVSALAGGKLLMTTSSLQITVNEVRAEDTLYTCKWQLQLGDLKGEFEMQETVRHDAWQKPKKDGAERDSAAVATASLPEAPKTASPQSLASGEHGTATDAAASTGITAGPGQQDPVSADYWKEKYRELAELYRRKDEEMSRMQAAVMQALRDPRPDRD